MNIDYPKIGYRIKQKRLNSSLTQADLAEKLNVSVGYVSQVERGITKISLDLLAEISAILDCDISFFVSETPSHSKQYLASEVGESYAKLSPKERKTIIDIMNIIIKNR